MDVAADGSLWIAERDMMMVKGRVLHVTPGMQILSSTDVRALPSCVRVEGSSGRIWVAHAQGLTLVDTQGQMLSEFAIGPVQSLAVSATSPGVWAAAATGDDRVVHYTMSGQAQQLTTRLSDGAKHIALYP